MVDNCDDLAQLQRALDSRAPANGRPIGEKQHFNAAFFIVNVRCSVVNVKTDRLC